MAKQAIEYYNELLAHAESLVGPQNPNVKDFTVEIFWDAPAVNLDGNKPVPQTFIDVTAKKLGIHLNDYSSNFENNVKFIQELSHEVIHCICGTTSRNAISHFEEGLAAWYSVQAVEHLFSASDAGFWRGKIEETYYADGFKAVDKLDSQLLINIRTGHPTISSAIKDDLVGYGVDPNSAEALGRKFY